MTPNFDDILLELSYRVDGGIPDLTKESHVNHLVDILREAGIDSPTPIVEVAQVYFSHLNEATTGLNKALSQKFRNPDTGNDVTVASALGYEKNSQAYNIAHSMLKKAGYSKNDIQMVDAGPDDKETKPNAFGVTGGGASVFGNTTPKKKTISGKDKTLAKVDTLRSKEFQQKQQPDDIVFAKKNKEFQIGPPPPTYKIPIDIIKNAKVAPRHLKALERMMNTRATQDTVKWSHFSNLPGGAGQISAQAGELMTLIGTTLNDKDARIFYNSLLQHESAQLAKNPNLKSEASRIVTKSWVQAAINNRSAILNRVGREYPGASIEAGAWDTQGEVEAMGLKDYKKNKGFSTDAYFKIKTKNGESILDEVSLKKSVIVNFINSGTGKFLEWDKNLPDNINPNVYQKREAQNLLAFGTKNIAILEKAALKDKKLQAIIKSKGYSLKDALAKLQSGKGNGRAIRKVVLASIQSAATQGDATAKKYLDLVQKQHRQHQHDVIAALGSNPKLKEGMLGAIREEFPLKAVGEGEESMAIGPNSLDRAILKQIFETSDFEQIKQGLVAMTDATPPYLAYKAGTSKKVIPIATIVAREDGVGYGGQIKFEMQLDKRFAKILEQANKEIYG
jgi:hypothetical protein